MAGLQRSEISFRRQGSSGLIWDDKFLAEIQQRGNQEQEVTEDKPSTAVGSVNTIERSRSNGGGRGFRTGKVSPAIEPPSPRVSACGFCSAFGKKGKNGRRPPKSGEPRT
ncbi:hypothetical protein CEY00_Acc22219 [Actinidia chinensis var. chinensis]|uniref:Uncharacterized protein n=1 Tax=Actinidia chinensis var. chinensis TaxID=1590841 RepID=A0A2R6PSM1_ACTCC|nr:hypothetical protein CEY00_Acc22219 [Actinidia chinensis var. chinensis]